MKKTAILFILAIAVFLSACSSENNENITSDNQPSVSTQETINAPTEAETKNDLPQSDNNSEALSNGDSTGKGDKILVAYFSRVGNTVWEDDVDVVTSASLNVVDGEFSGNAQLLAQMAQVATNGDLFLIQTEDTYPSDYRETTNVASVEQSDNTRPALVSHVDNMEQYDTIVLVYPNWWGDLPQPIVTFLEEYDFSGKTILPLCTHEGSRMGSSERSIASLCPNTMLLEGLAVRGGSAASAQSDVEEWINHSGILE